MAAEPKPVERRIEVRYPIRAKAVVQEKTGDPLAALATDISSSGMRLHFENACPLTLWQEVTIEIELTDSPDKPFSSWGVGKVAYVSGQDAGIHLAAGDFYARPGDARKG
jgi:c-di-GMP-binding flagellar brake protein YcgR